MHASVSARMHDSCPTPRPTARSPGRCPRTGRRNSSRRATGRRSGASSGRSATPRCPEGPRRSVDPDDGDLLPPALSTRLPTFATTASRSCASATSTCSARRRPESAVSRFSRVVIASPHLPAVTCVAHAIPGRRQSPATAASGTLRGSPLGADPGAEVLALTAATSNTCMVMPPLARTNAVHPGGQRLVIGEVRVARGPGRPCGRCRRRRRRAWRPTGRRHPVRAAPGRVVGGHVARPSGHGLGDPPDERARPRWPSSPRRCRGRWR